MSIQWILVGAFVIFIVLTSLKFKTSKSLSRVVYEAGEEKIFEEKPVKIYERGVGGGKNRVTSVAIPYIVLTNKRIIIVQKKEVAPDGYVRVVLSFDPPKESSLGEWWKRGYVTLQIDKEQIYATADAEGAYTIVFRILNPLLISSVQHVEQTVEITTGQLSVYEKAMGKKIEVRS